MKKNCIFVEIDGGKEAWVPRTEHNINEIAAGI
jgi:hypothetical protein